MSALQACTDPKAIIIYKKTKKKKKVGYTQAQRPLLFMSELRGFKCKGNINGTDESEITLDVM